MGYTIELNSLLVFAGAFNSITRISLNFTESVSDSVYIHTYKREWKLQTKTKKVT